MYLVQKLKDLNKLIYEHSNQIVVFSLVLFFVLEIVNRVYFFVFPENSLSLSFYPKLILQVAYITPVVMSYRHLNLIERGFIWFSVLLIIVGVFRFWGDEISFIGGMKHYNKLLLLFYVFLFLKLTKAINPTSLKVFDWIIVGNAILIFLGFVLNIEYLKSYPFTDRFGYSGVFCRFAINDTSLFYLIANFYLLYRLLKKQIKLWMFLGVFLTSFLIGTKAIYLQNACLVVYVVIWEKLYRRELIGISVIAIILLLLFYNFSFWNVEKSGWLSILSSNRSVLLAERFPLVLDNWDVGSFLFGFKYPFQYFVEMDIIDLTFTLGLIGAGMLIFFYFSILFQFNKANVFGWCFVVVFFLMVSLSGRYSYSGLNAFYLPFFVYYLMLQQKNVDSK